VRLVEWAAQNGEKLVIAAAQRSVDIDDPGIDDLHRIGTAARIVEIIRLAPGNYSAVLRGLARVRLLALGERDPFMQARYERVVTDENHSGELFAQLATAAHHGLPGLRGVGKAEIERLDRAESLGDLADIVSASLGYAAEVHFRQELLEMQKCGERAEAILAWFRSRDRAPVSSSG